MFVKTLKKIARFEPNSPGTNIATNGWSLPPTTIHPPKLAAKLEAAGPSPHQQPLF
jgi:hypothetical protein